MYKSLPITAKIILVVAGMVLGFSLLLVRFFRPAGPNDWETGVVTSTPAGTLVPAAQSSPLPTRRFPADTRQPGYPVPAGEQNPTPAPTGTTISAEKPMLKITATPLPLAFTTIPLQNCRGQIQPLAPVLAAPDRESPSLGIMFRFSSISFSGQAWDASGNKWLGIGSATDTSKSNGWVAAEYVGLVSDCLTIP
jgi:hypothetical protein